MTRQPPSHHASPRPLAALLDEDDVQGRLLQHLSLLYPRDVAATTCGQLAEMIDARPAPPRSSASREFDESSIWVIAYPDHITDPGNAPLGSLKEFLLAQLGGTVTGVHLLPFYLSSSDGGFAVADYLAVEPRLGGWPDVQALGRHFQLMLDGVFNHVSAKSSWFEAWRRREPAFADFFLELPPGADLTSVTRTRSTPLATQVLTATGWRRVWTTFSADQVDLNYANPNVLLAVTRVLLEYARLGARIIRLDAVGFLWKRLGSPCLHLPETHELVRLWRTVLELAAPNTVLMTETRGPHEQNIAYFGHGCDEADLVYQFELPPLVLDAFVGQDTTTLQRWLHDGHARPPCPRASWFNVLSTHDGIGMRPTEGLLSSQQVNRLIERTQAVGGEVTSVLNPDGSSFVFELNVSYFDALINPSCLETQAAQITRFVTAHALQLALPGVPAIYLHALLGGRNWREGVRRTGHVRAINRQKHDRRLLEAELRRPGSLRREVLSQLIRLCRVRGAEPAFHPRGAIVPVRTGRDVCAFVRVTPDRTSQVLCVYSVSNHAQHIALGPEDGLTARGRLVDLITSQEYATEHGAVRFTLEPFGHCWLRGQVRTRATQ
jgi:glucosylglycerate phosphorylase